MRLAVIVMITALASGCSSVEWKEMSTQAVRDGQGHVVGQKELLCDCRTGERIARIALFEPRFDERGLLVGYQEKVRGGAVLRDLNGRRIGTSFIDVRSGKSLTIVVHSQPAATPTASVTTVDELLSLAGLAPYIN